MIHQDVTKIVRFSIYILFAFFCQIHVASANLSKKLEDTFNKALIDAPKVAKLACTEHVGSHIIWLGESSNLIDTAKLYLKFQKQRREYLENLCVSQSEPDPFCKKASFLVRQVIHNGYTKAVIGQSFYESLKSLFTSNFLESFHLKSFYINAIFHSQVFKDTVDECVNYYGIDIPDLYDDILWRADLGNYSGYIASQVFSAVVTVGIFRKAYAKLPRIGRITLVLGSSSALTYIAYLMVKPIFKQIQKINTAIENEESVSFFSPVNRNYWVKDFNKIIELKDAAIAFNNSANKVESIIRTQKFEDILLELIDRSPALEYIRRNYVEEKKERGLSKEQEVDLALIDFALIQINAKLADDPFFQKNPSSKSPSSEE